MGMRSRAGHRRGGLPRICLLCCLRAYVWVSRGVLDYGDLLLLVFLALSEQLG
jgi:hypothetical protein